MTFFTKDEFVSKYPNYSIDEDWKIEAVSEIIYSQVGLKYRNPSWDENTCPTAIKNASMEQLRFMLEYDIIKHVVKKGGELYGFINISTNR